MAKSHLLTLMLALRPGAMMVLLIPRVTMLLALSTSILALLPGTLMIASLPGATIRLWKAARGSSGPRTRRLEKAMVRTARRTRVT